METRGYLCKKQVRMNPISLRLLSQHLICPRFNAPHEVVSWMGAMQAQEFRGMRWAVAMRTKKPSAKAFEEDYNAGRIVRTHLLRTTWQLVAGEDLGWILDLCRVPAMRGLHGWMKANGISIPAAEQDAVHRLFSDYLSTQRIAVKSDFATLLEEKGMAMEDHRLSYHIRLAEYSGLLCSGDLFPQKHSYALVADKLPGVLHLPREEALGMLALKYFRSHGPATLEDFVWWSGLNIGDCRQAILSLGSELTEERWKGLVFYLHRDCRTRGFRSGSVHLLPAYDEYLIGYKSRHVSLHPGHSHRAHNQTGNFWPVILQDGEVVGNWSPFGKEISVTPFPGASLNEEKLEFEKRRYAGFREMDSKAAMHRE